MGRILQHEAQRAQRCRHFFSTSHVLGGQPHRAQPSSDPPCPADTPPRTRIDTVMWTSSFSPGHTVAVIA